MADIMRAFIRIIETFQNNDPVNGNVTLTDVIDSAFVVEPNSFSYDGGAKGPQPTGVTIAGGKLTWTVGGFNRLPWDHNTGRIGEGTEPSSLTFTVRLTDDQEALREYYDTVDRLYTKTAEYNTQSNPNIAWFIPLSENPFYFTAEGVPQNGIAADGFVIQRLENNGWVTLKEVPLLNMLTITEARIGIFGFYVRPDMHDSGFIHRHRGSDY
jgi:hypothetical protein